MTKKKDEKKFPSVKSTADAIKDRRAKIKALEREIFEMEKPKKKK